MYPGVSPQFDGVTQYPMYIVGLDAIFKLNWFSFFGISEFWDGPYSP
jgi:hypothetical protein